MRIHSLYLYGTGAREDGMRYALGATFIDGGTDGCLALFKDKDQAQFCSAQLAQLLGVELSVLPSAE